MLTVALIGASRDAWGYLLGTVASEHTIDRAEGKAAYYMANGTPPGVWIGSGAEALGLTSGQEVEEAHLSALFGQGKHPVTGVAIGKEYRTVPTFEERVNARYRTKLIEADSAPTPEQAAAMEDEAREEVMGEPVPQSVAGFEFVFSPPKSVSSWWAVADPQLKDEIRQAHHAAIQATVQKLERDVVRTRVGADGVAQAHVRGITAATFDHWDSRNGDPQLHTHMLVSNRVQGEDGRWRTIDSRQSLFPAVATVGEVYDAALMDELAARFGIEWTVDEVLQHPQQYQQWLAHAQRPDSPAARHQFALDSGVQPGSVKWQIDGVPAALNEEYSTRSRAIRAEKDRLIREYVSLTGKQPSAAQIIKIRQRATLCTRVAKQHRSLRDLTQNWRDRALQYVGDSFLFADRLKDAGKQRRNDYPLWSFRHDDVNDDQIREAAEFVLRTLSTARSTWGKRNAETAALRAIASWRFRSPEDRDLTAGRVVDLVISQAVPLTPKNSLHTPRRFHTADGENMFHPEARDLYTTAEVWDAEERLIIAGKQTDGPRVDDATVAALIGTPTLAEARVLSPDQAAAVENIVTSGRKVDVLVGPAGAGKTTSLEKLRELWERQHGEGSVRGLAPTARAAEVLADSLGIQTENTAKWLHETAQGTRTLDGFEYQLRAGDLMIVDEASIAGTIALDRLREQADQAGAKLLLVGDWAQLAAVDAGGAFGLLAADRPDVAELHQLHRFSEEWEADASKLLRLGKTAGLAPYIAHDRISWGLDETIVTDAVEAWKSDEQAGSMSLLIAPTNDMVERLNDIARTWRVEQGQVDATIEATIQAGVASPGDRIVTRQNARTLRTDHDRWVKNNDEWTVVAVDEATGDITAAAGDERVILPGEYCRDHVQLAYATTAHRSQGRTVDTAHTIVDSSASRETFYVAMTRGKRSNRAYVVVDEDGHYGDPAAAGMTRTWRETLEHVILNRGGDISAHDTLADEADQISSIRQLAAEYQTLISDQLEREYLPVLAGMGLVDAAAPDSPYLGPVLANLRRLEQYGQQITTTVPELLAQRELGDARDVLAVLHHRLNTRIDTLREADTLSRYEPLLAAFGITAGSDPSSIRLYRLMAAIEQQGTRSLEDALRDSLEHIDRANSRDLPAHLAHVLRRRNHIDDALLLAANNAPQPDTDTRIAGLIERAPDFGDPDFTHALKDRELAIQLRAELIVDRAIEGNEPWIAALGTPQPGEESDWRRRAVTIACYRDLYGVDTDEPLGREHAQARNRERDRQIAAAALPVTAVRVPDYQAVEHRPDETSQPKLRF